jgi:hypothetical protein
MRPTTDTFTLMLHAIDAKDWDGVRRAFADRVEIDYSSLLGVPAATVDADRQVAGWRAFASSFDATPAHHRTICRRLADSRRVDAHTHIRAYHRMQRAAGRRHLDGGRPLRGPSRANPRPMEDRGHYASRLLSGRKSRGSERRPCACVDAEPATAAACSSR